MDQQCEDITNIMTTHKLNPVQKASKRIARKVIDTCQLQGLNVFDLLFQVGAYLQDERPTRELEKVFPETTRDIVHYVLTAAALLSRPQSDIMTALSVELMDMANAELSATEAMLEGERLINEGGRE